MLIEPPKKSNKGLLVVLFLLAAAVAVYFVFVGDFSNFSNSPSSLTVQNFWGKTVLYSASNKAGGTPERAKQLQINDCVQTGPDGGLDLKFKGTRVRVKENSEIRIQAPKEAERIQLKKGMLLVSSNTPLQISVPSWFENAEFLSRLIVYSSRGIFSVGFNPGKGPAWVRVLTGKVNARSGFGQPTLIKELQKGESAFPTASFKAASLSQTEWKNMSEAYELISKNAAEEAKQLDLSKKAGNLFESVFDHGTFYDPKSGFCERDFFQDTASGEVYLEARYDVFPREAIVGVYMKTRNFDASKFKTIKFDVRRVPDAGYPERFLLEMKYKGQVARKYLAKMVRQDWSTVEFPLTFRVPTPIDEMTLTFTNDQVGALKKGAVHLRRFMVEAQPAPPPPPPAPAAAAPLSSPNPATPPS